MKSPVVPWLDAQAQLELGIFHTDLQVRRGRHHLRHLLNAAPFVVVFDSSPVEGGGPSAPLAEWLADVRKSNEWAAMRDPPDFLPEEAFSGDTEQRSFSWVVREAGHGSWLTPHLYRTVDMGSSVRLVRQGHAGKDRRQQLGLDVHAGLPYEKGINHPLGVLDAQETAIQLDRQRRQPSPKDVGEGETFSWAHRAHLLTVDSLALRPTKSTLKVNGVNVRAGLIWVTEKRGRYPLPLTRARCRRMLNQGLRLGIDLGNSTGAINGRCGPQPVWKVGSSALGRPGSSKSWLPMMTSGRRQRTLTCASVATWFTKPRLRSCMAMAFRPTAK